MNKRFELNEKADVVAFETFFAEYCEKQSGFSIRHISLVDTFAKLQHHKDGRKIFTAILDIQINNVLLHYDMASIVNLWNKLTRENRNKGSILDSKENFFDKMDVHRFSTSLIFRYRALWDKIMGLYILIISPNAYETFISSKSKKFKFKKIMSTVSLFPEKILSEIDTLLTDFDDKFRTAEAHVTGKLRKYSLSMEPFHNNEQALFIDFANAMNNMIIIIGDMINSMPKFEVIEEAEKNQELDMLEKGATKIPYENN